ncbi:MAG TPA: cation-translocating P-type ATPase [Kiritimatiellia bacterium]|nr:cation-translocating P-type ATPase [Kiritimatiellia bacterium]
MQTSCGCNHHGPDAAKAQAKQMVWMFFGTAFMLNTYIADWLFAGNPMVAEFSAVAGAIILAIPIFWSAIKDLAQGHMHMNELVALAVLAAFSLGDFRTAGIVSFFMLLALLIETKSAQGAHAAIENLVKLTPTIARRIRPDGTEEDVPASQLAIGDIIRIRPGDAIPADGTVKKGETTLNEAMITGESLPRDKGPGDDVFAGTQNLTGMLEIQVTHIGGETAIGRVRELILAAEQTKLPITRIIDQYMRYYTPVILMIAALVWFVSDEWTRVISLLVLSCPCALILATPTAMVAALSAAARHGILIKNVGDLETAARIQAVVFDKTGTLSTGELGVARLNPRPGIAPSDLLYAAGTAEKFSKHPVAVALRSLAEQSGLPLGEPQSFREEAGQGVRADVDGSTVLSGRGTWLRQQQIDDPALLADMQNDTEAFSTLFVARDGQYLGWIGFQDKIRPEASVALEELRRLNIKRISMVTGDRERVAREVAEKINCPEYRAECLPGQKVDFVKEVKKDRYQVAFVGDGVNDAPALAASDIGIAMGAAGNDIAIHSATVALMNNDLIRVPYLIDLSRKARLVVYQNLGVGLVFIVGGITLSALDYINPIVAAIMHNAGTLIVVFNSARLIRNREVTEAT